MSLGHSCRGGGTVWHGPSDVHAARDRTVAGIGGERMRIAGHGTAAETGRAGGGDGAGAVKVKS